MTIVVIWRYVNKTELNPTFNPRADLTSDPTSNPRADLTSDPTFNPEWKTVLQCDPLQFYFLLGYHGCCILVHGNSYGSW